ncbi:Uncharacterised protein [Mycobacteroides abscessus subsp. abscessus]|nr:Uncharacterised protein [Mycobacteroides abscessus subsp. abscessus]
MIIRMVVVLPAPLAPTKPTVCPSRTVNETLSTATRSPKRRVRPWTSNMLPPVWSMSPSLPEAAVGGSPTRLILALPLEAESTALSGRRG